MSEREKAVRELAEEIASSQYNRTSMQAKAWRTVAALWERRLTAFLDERKGQLQDERDRAVLEAIENQADGDRARAELIQEQRARRRAEAERDLSLAEGAGLREALERIGHGSAPGIDEDEGWLRAAIIARSALASSPLSELAGEVLEAAVEKRRSAQAFSKTQVGRVDRKAEREAFDRRGRAERRYEKCLSAYMAELAWEGGEGG